MSTLPSFQESTHRDSAASDKPPGRFVYNACVLCICGLVFYSVLATDAVSRIGLQVRYDTIFLPILAAGLFSLLARMPQHLAMAGVLLLPAGLCGMVLSGVWHGNVSDLATLAGLYPHSDGRSYLEGGLNLLHNHELGDFASRRPLSVVVWAFLLAAGGGNIKVCTALMVFICALTIGALTRLVIKKHGWVAGYVVFLTLFLFYRRFVGTFLTEHLGLVLGCLGFVLLWISLSEHRTSLVAAGLLMLTLALNARAGAFFILPALALWAGWNWRGEGLFSLKTCAIACLAIMLGFGLNSFVLRTVGHPEASMGNFSYTLYGLVHGGDWTLALEDHPELTVLPAEQRHQAIYDLAQARIVSQPTSLLLGAAKAYNAFFFSSQGPYSFVFFSLQRSILKYPLDQVHLSTADLPALWRTVLDYPWKYLQIAATYMAFSLLFLLSVLGWVFLFKRRTAATWLLVFAWTGILASVPFIPPWDVDMMRVYVATIPFLIILPAFGLSFLTSCVRKADAAMFPGQQEKVHNFWLLVLSSGITLLFVILPILFRPQPGTQSPQDISCQSGEQPWVIRLVRGSLISLGMEDGISPQDGTDSTASRLRENMGVLFSRNPHRAEAFLGFSAGQSLALGYERFSGKMRYLVIEKDATFFHGQTWTHVCSSPFYPDSNTTWWKIRSALGQR
jgi:hypothetical protein